ncbi:hypothetical protein [Streptomyces sp. RFCAC02]|uniref:hypothetical protein n=1 Tax=Streptomyces sp. RFCAC02 TaxID=2499143 RepID=UPI0010224FC5|nr:hypothetical protein [Streptomyces sp. RFCAC02]
MLCALSGCSFPLGCTDTTAERGEAGVSVQVEDTYGQRLGVTAEVVDWRLEPHPQVPAEGDRIHFHYRFDGADEMNGPAVDACAVDEQRVALGCLTVYSDMAWPEPDGTRTGDEWLSVERPERVARVLLIPNDQSYDPRYCEQDLKDGGGTHPPEPAEAGDQL